ncbi:hypothetical protein [Roseivirga sp. E12]|uniref:hypothetical protein n=1 Tax=Roseivirga sp. E12 TaxID=2819237 RepID=UPI001ABD3CD4|nr:hypothetical protein [Roseivirga sp. E12]MBO3700595.1 hypothetical protein [Roseivirga sp. E12]
MNFLKRFKSSLLGLIITVSIVGCGSGTTDPSLQDLAFEKLAGSWSMPANGGVLLDGQDVSLNYPGFSLSFTDGGYQTTNGGDLFRASGTWTWTNENAQTLTLDTGEEVTIQNLTETQFRFTFFHQGSVAAGIRGNYTINVNK